MSYDLSYISFIQDVHSDVAVTFGFSSPEPKAHKVNL